MSWSAFLTALGLVFVAELGDKTQLAVVTQVCKSRRPWPVFVGASLALALVTVVGAMAGQALGRLVPQDIVRSVAVGAFLLMGVLMGTRAWRSRADKPLLEACNAAGSKESTRAEGGWCWQVFGATLVLLFVAEMGDKTQLAVLGLAGESSSAWAVFLGGSLALIGVTALGVLGGEALCRLVPERTMLWVSAAAFIVVGALMACGLG